MDFLTSPLIIIFHSFLPSLGTQELIFQKVLAFCPYVTGAYAEPNMNCIKILVKASITRGSTMVGAEGQNFMKNSNARWLERMLKTLIFKVEAGIKNELNKHKCLNSKKIKHKEIEIRACLWCHLGFCFMVWKLCRMDVCTDSSVFELSFWCSPFSAYSFNYKSRRQLQKGLYRGSK